jgi:hypothetical protein
MATDKIGIQAYISDELDAKLIEYCNAKGKISRSKAIEIILSQFFDIADKETDILVEMIKDAVLKDLEPRLNEIAKPVKEVKKKAVKTDSITLWVDDNVIYDFTYSGTPIGDYDFPKSAYLFPNYLDYCKKHNLKPEGIIHFSNLVVSYCESIGHAVMRKRTSFATYLTGIRLKLQRS